VAIDNAVNWSRKRGRVEDRGFFGVMGCGADGGCVSGITDAELGGWLRPGGSADLDVFTSRCLLSFFSFSFRFLADEKLVEVLSKPFVNEHCSSMRSSFTSAARY
jgi:hypothetical protein